MKVYIASKYHEFEINNKIHDILQQKGISSFLPATIDKRETSLDAAMEIRDICADEIKQSDVLLAIDAKDPFGSDVGWEVGYAYALKTECGCPIEIVNLKLCTEAQSIRAMNDPCFSYVAFSADDIIEYLLKKQSVNDQICEKTEESF